MKIAEVTDLASSGTLLAVASGLGLSFWNIADPRNPKSLWTPEVPKSVEPRWGQVAFDAKGSVLAYGKDSTIRLYDVTDPRSPEQFRELSGEREFGGFAFSPDGRTIATHDNAAGTVTLWDVPTDAKRAMLPAAEKEQFDSRPPPALAIGPTGLLAYAGTGNTIRLYDVTGEPVERAAIEGHSQPVISLAFTPDGRTLASGSSDSTVRVTDVSSPTAPVSLGALDDHAADVTGVSFGPNGAPLVTASQDVTVRLWPFSDPRRRTAVTSISGPAASGALATTPDRTLTVTGGAADDSVTLWDTGGAKPVRRGSADVGGDVLDAALTSKLLVVARNDSVLPVRLLSAPGLRELATIRGCPASPSAVAVSGDGTLLAVGDMIGRITVYDIRNPEAPRQVSVIDKGGRGEKDKIGWVTGLAFDPTRPLLAATSMLYRTSVWDLTAAAEPLPLAQADIHADQAQGAVFSPDGKWLATTDRVGAVLLWRMDPQSVREKFVPAATVGIPSSGIPVVDFSQDGRRLVAALDKNVYVWDLDSGGPVQTVALTYAGADSRRVVFGAQGKTVLVASSEPAVDVIALDPGGLTEELCRGAGPAVTEDQWRQYVPGHDYQPGCPWLSVRLW